MVALRTLDERRAAALETTLRADRPRLGPRRLRSSTSTRCWRGCRPRCATHALEAIDALAPAAEGGADALAERARTPEFGFIRALACEAYYSDFVAPGKRGPGRVGRDRLQLAARDPAAQGLVLPGDRVKEDFDVVVVGSGAGGGVVAGELAQRGRDVLLLEVGPHLTAADFVRWEAKATHDMWWPLRLAPLPGGEMLALLAGRCVGGTTTINTKVALRAHERDVAKWHPASGLTNERGEPFAAADLEPYYDRVEQVLGVRERSDWPKSVRTVEAGFRALGVELEPVTSYTDANCMRCGSCLQGCPTNAGKSTMNTYIHDAWARGLLELRANAAVERVLIEDGSRDRASSTSTPRASGTPSARAPSWSRRGR